jgi:tetratricopeptide (TPR) repeat protein
VTAHLHRLVESSGSVADAIRAAEGEVRRLMTSNPADALRLADSLCGMADSGDPESGAIAARARGHALRALDRHEEALDEYATARRGFLRAGNRTEAARTLIGRVDAFMYLDRFDDAQATGRRALSEFRKLGDGPRAGRVLLNLGNLEYRRDRPDRALGLYRESRAALADTASDLDLAIVDYNQANILAQLGEIGEAERKYVAVRTAARSAGHALFALHAEYGRAALEAMRARYPSALRILEECEQGFASIDRERAVNNCRLDRAEIWDRLGLHDESAHAAGQAARGFRALGLGTEATRARLLEGLAALGRGDAAAGRRRARRAIRDLERLGNPAGAAAALVRLAQRESGGGSRGTIEALARAADRLGRAGLRELRAEASIEIARRALPAGNARVVAARLGAATRDFSPDLRPDLEVRALHLRFLASDARGDSAGASRIARRCLQGLERVRGRLGRGELLDAHFVGARETYRDILRVEAERNVGRPDLFFPLLERVESGEVVGKERVGGAARNDPEVRALRERIAGLLATQRKLLPGDGRAVIPTVRELRRAERALAERVRGLRLRAEREGSSPAREEDGSSLEAFRATLRPGECWLHWFDAGASVGALVVRREGARLLPRVFRQRDVEETMRRLHHQAEMLRLDEAAGGSRSLQLTASAERTLARLSALCLEPLELEETARLAIRPAAGLEAVPWGALPWRDAPLWNRAVVSISPGLRSFRRARARRRSASPLRRAAVWAVPDGNLPHVEREAELVAERVPGATIRTCDEATRASFLRDAPQATLVHFAGHGVFRQDNPLFSSLRFADGDLTFLDVEELRLRAHLVVLGACRTGGSRAELGLGAGLSRGFLTAGARALLVGLWPVGDAATRDLFDVFYRELAGGNRPFEALRAAAREIRAGGAHPADWAAFQAIGDS